MFYRQTFLALFTGHHPKWLSQTENVRDKTNRTEATESEQNTEVMNLGNTSEVARSEIQWSLSCVVY